MVEPDRLGACAAPISRIVSPEADFVGLGINSLDTIIRLPHYPEFNSQNFNSLATKVPGGQTATAAVACQQWGLRSRYIGKIGDDERDAHIVSNSTTGESKRIWSRYLAAPVKWPSSSSMNRVASGPSYGSATLVWI